MNDSIFVVTNCLEVNRLLAKLGEKRSYHPNAKNSYLDDAYGLRFGLYKMNPSPVFDGISFDGHIELISRPTWNAMVCGNKLIIKTVGEMIEFLTPKPFDEFRVVTDTPEIARLFIKIAERLNLRIRDIDNIRSCPEYIKYIRFSSTSCGLNDKDEYQKQVVEIDTFKTIEESLKILGVV